MFNFLALLFLVAYNLFLFRKSLLFVGIYKHVIVINKSGPLQNLDSGLDRGLDSGLTAFLSAN